MAPPPAPRRWGDSSGPGACAIASVARSGCAGEAGGKPGALEEPRVAARLEPQDDEEDEEEALPHSEAVDVFQEGLAMVVQDPLLCDLPIQVREGRVVPPGGGRGADGPWDRWGCGLGKAFPSVAERLGRRLLSGLEANEALASGAKFKGAPKNRLVRTFDVSAVF